MTIIENPTYKGPFIEVDKQGGCRTWPSFAGPEPEELLPGWAHYVDDGPLPVLVEPGVLHDPMEVGSDG